MTIQFDYLSPTLEAQVIQAQSGVANQDAADELVAFATDLRKMNSDDRFAEPTDIGTATLVTAMTCLAQFNMSQVLEATILPLFDVDDVDDVMTVARGRFSDL
jgi:pyridoxal biosynthesis lyase PdxS